MAVDGHWLGDLSPFWQPPLYPYFLGLVFALFGPDYYIARLVQAVLGSGKLRAHLLFGPPDLL